MTLSNIRNEPQREITETMIGLVVVGGSLTAAGAADYYAALQLAAPTTTTPDLVFAMLLIPFATAFGLLLLLGLIFFIHFIGEEICDNLERRGYRLRPARTGRCR